MQKSHTASNECPVVRHETIWCWGSSNDGAMGNRKYSFSDISPRSTLARVVAHDTVLSMSQTEVNCVLMLNWIAWNRTVLTFKQRTYAKLNCLK